MSSQLADVNLGPNQLGSTGVALNPANQDLDMNGFAILNASGGGSSGIQTITGTPGQIIATTDTGGNATISLDNTSVTPGPYTLASITVDALGRVTQASSGSLPTLGTMASQNANAVAITGGNATGLTVASANTFRTTNISSEVEGGTIAVNSDLNLNGKDIAGVNDISMSGALPTITSSAGPITLGGTFNTNVTSGALTTITSLGSVSIGSANIIGTKTSVEHFTLKDNVMSNLNAGEFVQFQGVDTISQGTNTITMKNANNKIGMSVNLQAPSVEVAGLLQSSTTPANQISMDYTSAHNIAIAANAVQMSGDLSVAGAASATTVQGGTIQVSGGSGISKVFDGTYNTPYITTAAYQTPVGNPVTLTSADIGKGFVYQIIGSGNQSVVVPGTTTDTTKALKYLLIVNSSRSAGTGNVLVGTTTPSSTYVAITLKKSESCLIQYCSDATTPGTWFAQVVASNKQASVNPTLTEVLGNGNLTGAYDIVMGDGTAGLKANITNVAEADIATIKVNQLEPLDPLVGPNIGIVGNLEFDPTPGAGSIGNIQVLSGLEGNPIAVPTGLVLSGSAITNCITIDNINAEIATIQGDITTIEADLALKADKANTLWVNSQYANDGQVDIQTAINAVGASQGQVVYVGAGSYGGASLSIANKNNMYLLCPGSGGNPATITELAGSRGLDIQSTSQRIRISNLSVKGSTTIGSTGNNYYQSMAFATSVTITGSGNHFFYDCEFSGGTLWVLPQFTGVIGLVRCNFTGLSSFNFTQPVAAQVQITQALGLTAAPANAILSGINQIGLTTVDSVDRVQPPTGSASALILGNLAGTQYLGPLNANSQNITNINTLSGTSMRLGSALNANSQNLSNVATMTAATVSATDPVAGSWSSVRCASLGSDISYNAATGELSLLSQTGATLGTATINTSGSLIGAWLYTADTTVPPAIPPAAGKVEWNNATQSSATQITFSHLTSDNIDIDLFLAVIVPGYKFVLQDKNNSANYQRWNVTSVVAAVDNSYYTYGVSLDAATHSFSNNNDLLFVPIAGQAPPTTPTLATVMAAGNNVGNNDLNMNSRNINSCETLFANSVVGSLVQADNITVTNTIQGTCLGAGYANSLSGIGSGLVRQIGDTDTQVIPLGTNGQILRMSFTTPEFQDVPIPTLAAVLTEGNVANRAIAMGGNDINNVGEIGASAVSAVNMSATDLTVSGNMTVTNPINGTIALANALSAGPGIPFNGQANFTSFLPFTGFANKVVVVNTNADGLAYGDYPVKDIQAGDGISVDATDGLFTIANTGILGVQGSGLVSVGVTAGQATITGNTPGLGSVLAQSENAGGRDIDNVGTVTATTFVGDLTGTASFATDLRFPLLPAPGLLYQAASEDTQRLDNGANGQVLTMVNNVPTFSDVAIRALAAGTGISVSEFPEGTWTIAATGGGGGGGTVDSIVAGANIEVNSNDPANPTVSLSATLTNVTSANIGTVTTGTLQQSVNGQNLNITNSGSAGDIRLSTNNATNALVVKTTTGNVGIATTAPTEKLDVNGNVKATIFKGALEGTADLAFDLNGGLAGSIPYQAAPGNTAFLPLEDDTRVLTGGSSAPTWTAITDLVPNKATTADDVNGSIGILYNSATNATAHLSPGLVNQVLIQGPTTPPVWTNQDALAVGSATLATRATNLAAGSAGVIPYQTGSGTTSFSGVGTTGQLLTSTGTGAPAWTPQSGIAAGTADNITGGAQGQILFQSGSGTTAKLAVPASNQFLRYNTTTGLPNWNSPFAGGVLVASNTATGVSSGSFFTAATATGPYTFPAGSILQMSWLAQGIAATVTQQYRFGVQYSTDGTTWFNLGPGVQGTTGDPGTANNPAICQTGICESVGRPLGFSTILVVSSALTNVQLRLRCFTNTTPTSNAFVTIAWTYFTAA